MITDTIAAIATPPGAGGIGIIRISGSRAVEVVSQIFTKSSSIESHKVVHGYIFDNSCSIDSANSTLFNDSIIDEVLVIPMLAPRSYTAEDVVEIHAHSGPIVMQVILELILSRGVRLAQPGEFTKRAFLNGRIDLTQAEAVADVINAKSAVSLKMAVSQGLGNLRKTITDAREELISILVKLEVSLDFPEEGLDIISRDELTETIKSIFSICQRVIKRYEDAHFLKDGLKITICGSPNVGKSSLMNRLLEIERSIVTEFPGTTRDLIEESIIINGIPIIISDTAGIHQSDDPVEKIGIERAKVNIIDSDIVLFMEDVAYLLDEDLDININYLRLKVKSTVPAHKKVIVVLNKIDKLIDVNKLSGENKLDVNELMESNIPLIPISAKFNIGIENLKNKIVEVATAHLNITETSSVVPNLRHKTALKKASKSLNLALRNLRDNFLDIKSDSPSKLDCLIGNFSSFGEETLAIDIKNAIDLLGEITGDNAGFDILDNIFSKFCIGK